MKDQLGRNLQFDGIPKRIVSLVPSQTELLFELGLDAEVVGITKFCVHPDTWFTCKQRVGGTKKINIETVSALRPDIIFANREENTREDVEKLESLCPVWISDIQTFDDALRMISSIGSITGKSEKGNQIVAQLRELKSQYSFIGRRKPSALYLIWKKPYMSAGTDTFIHDMMNIAGFCNVAQETRYPALSIDAIVALNPEIVLLSSEPYPFKQKDAEEFSRILPDSRILLVDGELFSWYGSRLLRSFDYFSGLHEQIQ